jgi:hypothetical protein
MKISKHQSKKKNRIVLNEFDLDELRELAKDPHFKRTANRFLRLQKRGRPEDMQIIANLFHAYGPVCDIEGHDYEGVISTGQLLLLYIWDAQDLRRQLLEQLAELEANRGGATQLELFGK